MKELSEKINDMIQQFDLGRTPDMLASRLLDILQVMNERIDSIEINQNKKTYEHTKTPR